MEQEFKYVAYYPHTRKIRVTNSIPIIRISPNTNWKNRDRHYSNAKYCGCCGNGCNHFVKSHGETDICDRFGSCGHGECNSKKCRKTITIQKELKYVRVETVNTEQNWFSILSLKQNWFSILSLNEETQYSIESFGCEVPALNKPFMEMCKIFVIPKERIFKFYKCLPKKCMIELGPDKILLRGSIITRRITDCTDLAKRYSSEELTREFVEQLFTQDAFYRKMRKWPLIQIESIFSHLEKISYKFPEFTRLFSFGVDPSYTTFQREMVYRGFPLLEKLFDVCPHIVVAGGSAVRTGTSDVDIFFYGLEKEKATKELVKMVKFLVSKLTGCTLYRNKYTFTVRSETNKAYQFILRLYAEPSQIIGGFDLGICSVFYNAEGAWTTPLGLFCLETGYVPIDTTRRSLSFEKRIEKYSHNFRVLLPGINIENVLVSNKNVVEIHNMKFREWGKEFHISSGGVNGEKNDYQSEYYLSNSEIMWANINYAVQERTETITFYSTCNNQEDLDKFIKLDLKKGFDPEHVDFLASKPDNPKKSINVFRIKRLFGKFAEEIIAAIFEEDYQNIDEIWGRYVVFVQEQFEKAANDLRKSISWITENPGRQWTASFNPILEHPSKWYKDYYTPVVSGIKTDRYVIFRLCCKNFKVSKDVFKLLMDWWIIAEVNDFERKYFYFGV